MPQKINMVVNKLGAPLNTQGELKGKTSFEDLVEFPASFNFKVIVKNEEDFASVIALIEGIAGSKILKRGQSRLSKKGTYRSCDLLFMIKDAPTLRAVYEQAGTHPLVLHIL